MKNDGMSYIIEGLRPLAMRCDQLVLDPKNARDHDERNLATIRASLQRFGQRQVVVVQRQGMRVRAGNGRLMVARELGWEYIAAVVVDEADVEAAAFALVDNRSAELASWNLQQVADTLAQVRVEIPDFPVMDLGWNDTELAGLELAASWDAASLQRENLHGTRDNVDRSTLVVRFTLSQKEQLVALHLQAGLGEDVTADTLLQLLGSKGASC